MAFFCNSIQNCCKVADRNRNAPIMYSFCEVCRFIVVSLMLFSKGRRHKFPTTECSHKAATYQMVVFF